MTSESIVLEDDAAGRFATLLARHAGIVHKVATTYCRDRDDRSDLAQEITAQLWRAFPRYDPDRLFSTWMYRIALRTGLWLGMVWWVPWIPFTLAGFDAALGVDLYAHMAGPIHWMIAASFIGLLATLALLRWSMRAGSPALRKALLESATGRSLRRANAEVEALAAFAAE